MRLFLLITFAFSIVWSAPQKECSQTNLKKLVQINGKLLGILGGFSIQVSKLQSQVTKKEISLETLNSEILKRNLEKSKATEAPLKELESLIAKSPECNIDGLYTTETKN